MIVNVNGRETRALLTVTTDLFCPSRQLKGKIDAVHAHLFKCARVVLRCLYVRRQWARVFSSFSFLSTTVDADGENPASKKRSPRTLLPWGLCVMSLAFVSADEIAAIRDQGLLKPKAERV